MRTKRRTRTTTGASRRRFLSIGGAALVPSLAAEIDSYAVVAGTVFREPGFALPKAEITLTVLQAPPVRKKPKEQRTQSDARGEFSFRVPAGAARYRLSVSFPGLQPQQKELAVAADERVDAYFELKAARR